MESIQIVNFEHPAWFNERMVSQISLFDMAILILLKLIQSNFSMKDSHIHLLYCGILLQIARKASSIQSSTCLRMIRFESSYIF